MTTQSLTASQARRIALAAQGFGAKRTERPIHWVALRRQIERIGLLQIDSVNVCVRSHYMPLFSRLGSYNLEKLDQKLLMPKRRERQFFEYLGHEASFLPVHTHPLFRWRMRAAADGVGVWKMVANFARERPASVKRVLDMIRAQGPTATREVAEEGEKTTGLWEWKGSKVALEYLFWTGQLTIHSRRGFERIFDVPERVLPAGVLKAPTPSPEDSHRRLTAMAANALGIATAADLRDYFRLPAKGFDKRVCELVESGEIEPVTVAGWKQPAYLARGARLPPWVRGAALLTPFDPIVWFRPRAERLFDFVYRIEIYTPSEKRRYGYYCLPFLLDDQLVARVDLKADRAESALIVQSAHGEPDRCTPEVARALTSELRRLADWQGLERLVIRANGDLAPSLAPG